MQSSSSPAVPSLPPSRIRRTLESLVSRLKREAGLREACGHHYLALPNDASCWILDAGANRGDFARHVLSEAPCRVVALEPVPELLRQHPRDARLESRRLLLAGHAEPSTAFFASTNTEAGSTILALAGRSGDVEELRVPSTTLEALVLEQSTSSIALLKLDIEGLELDVLETASDAIVSRISQLTVEFHDFLDASHRPRIRRIFKHLSHLGFRVVRISLPRGDHSDVLFYRTDAVRGGRRQHAALWTLRTLALPVYAAFHRAAQWR